MAWQKNYMLDLCVPPVATVSTRAEFRFVSRRRHLGNRAFCVAGPAPWNNLPPDIRTAST